MTPEDRHYCWDRLVRGVIRGDSMTQAQKDSLVDFISSKVDTENEEDMKLDLACSDFLEGELFEDAAVSGYMAAKIEGFDVDAYRAALSPVNTSKERDDRLAKIFG